MRSYRPRFGQISQKWYHVQVSVSPVVVSGSIAIDRIMRFDGQYRDYIHTDKLDSLSISIFLQDQTDAHGGVGANIAYTLALLGDSPVLLGSAGADAADYMQKLAGIGVDISHAHTSKLPTAAFNVITDSSNNQVGGFYPGAMFDSDSLRFEPWRGTDAIAVIAPHDPVGMRRQVAECHELGLRLLYDIGQQVSNTDGDIMAEGVRSATVLIVNDYEMTVLSKKTGMSINSIKSTVPVVVTTLGERGSVIEGRDVPEAILIDIVLPSDVVDPTGAGDAYRAGFLYGYARNWPLKTCGQLGATCATFAIESAGTQAHEFTFDEVANRCAAAFNNSLPGVLPRHSQPDWESSNQDAVSTA